MLWDFPLIRAYFDAMATDYFCASIPVYANGGTSSKVFHLRGQWEGIPLLDALSKLLRRRPVIVPSRNYRSRRASVRDEHVMAMWLLLLFVL